MISNEYLEWVNKRKEEGSKILPLTNTQHRFVEWLLEEDQAKNISLIGNLNELFVSVRQHLKDGGSFKKKDKNE
jgi:hypothetical protein